MKILIILLSLISTVFAQKHIIKVEGSNLFSALAYTESSPYVPMYDWDIGDSKISPIIWDPNGNNWSPDGFERKGKAYITNNGKITHTIVDTETKPGYWTLLLLGSNKKIIKATLTPNKVTLENPSINIDKAFIQEEVICEENTELKHTVYRIKFPKKVSFWMEEKKTISNEGNKSTYVVTFDEKPVCATKVVANKKINSNKISENTKGRMKLFLEAFYKSGEESYPGKTLSYYAASVDRYFSIKNATKEDILTDKIRYYKKWTKRKYDFRDLEVLDSYITDGVQYYIINTVVDWHVVSKEGKSVSNTSYNIIKLIENDNGFLIKSIKSLDNSTKNINTKKSLSNNSFKQSSEKKLYQQTREPEQKTISFNENGIGIHFTYPSSVKAGELFRIRAEMTNNIESAKQGGLTLSFPDMGSMRGHVLDNNFNLLNGYSTPDKIYNKDTGRNMITEYFMVEGWENKTWSYGSTKYFSVELTAPQNLEKLRVNLRGVLWIRNKHDLREIPSRSSIYDQQGFAVKQFSIDIN